MSYSNTEVVNEQYFECYRGNTFYNLFLFWKKYSWYPP